MPGLARTITFVCIQLLFVRASVSAHSPVAKKSIRKRRGVCSLTTSAKVFFLMCTRGPDLLWLATRLSRMSRLGLRSLAGCFTAAQRWKLLSGVTVYWFVAGHKMLSSALYKDAGLAGLFRANLTSPAAASPLYASFLSAPVSVVMLVDMCRLNSLCCQRLTSSVPPFVPFAGRLTLCVARVSVLCCCAVQ